MPCSWGHLRTAGDYGGGANRLRRQPRIGGEGDGRSHGPADLLREIMLRVYRDRLVGPAPRFPREIEEGIDEYLAIQGVLEAVPAEPPPVSTLSGPSCRRLSPCRRRSPLRSASTNLAEGVVVVSNLDHTCERY
jgi:hypothetical protein